MGYRVSKRAGIELDAIVIYTIQMWGERQADKYLNEMDSMFRLLAENPDYGGCGLGEEHAPNRTGEPRYFLPNDLSIRHRVYGPPSQWTQPQHLQSFKRSFYPDRS
jgi:plasmid stabilization system protein ParE